MSSTTFADHPTVAFGINVAGPINTISASTLPAGTFTLGLQTEVIDNDEFNTDQLEGFAADGLEGVHTLDSITNTSISASYGVTDDLSVTARLPNITRKNIREGELEGGIPEAHTHGDSSGFGDLLIMGQYSITKNDSSSISVNVGVKAPTGETHEKDNDGVRFETEFQPGSGSWDFLLGIAVSKTSGVFGYYANILYNKTTEGSQSTEIGTTLSYNAAVAYRLNSESNHHEDHHNTDHAHSDTRLDLILELNGDKRNKDKISGVSEEHSGGNTILISPGIKVSSSDFGGFMSFGIPVVKNQNGTQSDIGKRIVAGVSVSF